MYANCGGADIGQAAGDEVNCAVGAHGSGSQAGRSLMCHGVLDGRLRAVRHSGPAGVGH
jgi:hypothetical protein